MFKAATDKVRVLCHRLRDIGDALTEVRLLAHSFTAPRVDYLLRATPVAWTRGAGLTEVLDDLVDMEIDRVIGPLSEDALAQARLPLRLGGLGIPAASAIHAAAFTDGVIGSWPLVHSGLDGAAPPGAADAWNALGREEPEVAAHGADAMRAIGAGVPLPAVALRESPLRRRVYEILAQKAAALPTRRGRLLQVAKHGSLGWIAPPPPGSRPFRVSASAFVSYSRYVLGSEFPTGHPCPMCGEVVAEQYGDHALCCGGDSNRLYRRHNAVRAALGAALEGAGFTTEYEVAIPGSAIRPADILVRALNGCTTAIDVTVRNPLRQGEATRATPAGWRVAGCLTEAERAKGALYAAPCKAAGWSFVVAAVTTLGGQNGPMKRLIRTIAARVAQATDTPVVAVTDSIRRSLSATIAQEVGEQLLHCEGKPVARWLAPADVGRWDPLREDGPEPFDGEELEADTYPQSAAEGVVQPQVVGADAPRTAVKKSGKKQGTCGASAMEAE